MNNRGNNSCRISSLFRPPLIHFREHCKIILLALNDLRKAGRNSGPVAGIRTVTSTELFYRMALSCTSHGQTIAVAMLGRSADALALVEPPSTKPKRHAEDRKIREEES